MQATLLVELLTEELPPKSLAQLGAAFTEALFDGLVIRRLLAATTKPGEIFATPRRLAALIPGVLENAEDREIEVSGPPVSAPAQAVAGFARKQGVEVSALEQRDTPKGKVYVAKVAQKGGTLDALLAELVVEAVRKLPIPKVMRWGSGEAQFVRPVHGLILLHGSRVVPGTVLGLESGNRTHGHRFMGKQDLVIGEAGKYQSILKNEGMVIADIDARKAEIERLLQAEAKSQEGALGEHEALLGEVAALVEHPNVYVGTFDKGFLAVPQECLILTMRQNQKYFPLFDAAGKLLPKFLIVSNMKVADSRHIVGGNQRVVRPRLEDARFFYTQDRKVRLDSRVPGLGKVVYHNKLGTQLQRVERIKATAGSIARLLDANVAVAQRTAYLCKADLLTGMVGEFPELQGTMGRYYALHDGEPREIADAIQGHYLPRFAGDSLPEGTIASAVALADKLDALTGLFGIGQVPTGDKDPFALRRAALGMVRILVELKLALPLPSILNAAGCAAGARTGLEDFIYERARGYFLERGYTAIEVEAVLSMRPARLDLVPSQLEAVRAFSALPEAESLAAANKRIGNILKQAEGVGQGFDPALLVVAEEKTLAAAYALSSAKFEEAYGKLQYTAALKSLATLRAPVDAFFDKVMVMDRDPKVRANRIGFLGTLHGTMNRIADLSKLAK